MRSLLWFPNVPFKNHSFLVSVVDVALLIYTCNLLLFVFFFSTTIFVSSHYFFSSLPFLWFTSLATSLLSTQQTLLGWLSVGLAKPHISLRPWLLLVTVQQNKRHYTSECWFTVHRDAVSTSTYSGAFHKKGEENVIAFILVADYMYTIACLCSLTFFFSPQEGFIHKVVEFLFYQKTIFQFRKAPTAVFL